MKSPTRVLLAAACALAVAAPDALAGPTVTIRVEAASQGTLVPTQTVTLGDGVFRKNASNTKDCRRDSVAGALELATGGDWGGAEHPTFGQQIDRIRSVYFPNPPGDRYWAVYVNRGYASGGNCDPVQQGDEIVLSATCGGPSATDCFTAYPLWLTTPRTVRPGVPFAVKVTTLVDGPNFSVSEGPFAGATVAGGGANATTGADGAATVTLSQRGPVTLTADAAGRPRHALSVCVSDGADGYCGNPTPAGQIVQGTPTVFVPDRIAPKASVTGIRRGQRFSRAKAPQVLKGAVDEAGGILMVKLRLTRNDRGRCSAYSGKRERFIRRPKCGADTGWWFKVSDRADWEYQLASKLPRGRYVLDVNVIDKAYNRDDARRPGRNRIVFTVR